MLTHEIYKVLYFLTVRHTYNNVKTRMMTALDIILMEIKTLESLQVHSSFNASKDFEQQKSEFVI